MDNKVASNNLPTDTYYVITKTRAFWREIQNTNLKTYIFRKEIIKFESFKSQYPKCRFMMLPPRDMTVVQVRQILAEVVEALEVPDVVLRLEQAKAEAGRNVTRKLKIVYPIIRQIEINIIEKHGYDNSTNGLVQFTERVRDTEGLDEEIARLHLLIRNHYLSNESASSFMNMLTNS